MINFDSFPSDSYDLALLVSAVLLLLVGGILLLRKPWRKDDPYPFEQKSLGTESQRIWLLLLQDAVRGRFDVLPSVRLDDLLEVKSSLGAKPARIAADSLTGRWIDFVLLAPGTLDPLAAVQLQRGGQFDVFCRNALLAAGLPALLLPAEPVPAAADLRDLLHRKLDGKASRPGSDPVDDWVLGNPAPELIDREEWSFGGTENTVASPDPAPGPAGGLWPSCPECGSARVVRQVNRGRYAGKSFLVCSRYPACQSLQPVGHRPS